MTVGSFHAENLLCRVVLAVQYLRQPERKGSRDDLRSSMSQGLKDELTHSLGSLSARRHLAEVSV